tara:strand:- start:1107 stop:1871 length:765 start_codon:yes stop_codon:yes gene_type:complete
MNVIPKKHFGQHFLINENISKKIADALDLEKSNNIIEIGPGTGSLTKFLIPKSNNLQLIEIDCQAVDFLKKQFPNTQIIHCDFLKLDLNKISWENYNIIGNFPYNISTQILFKIIEHRNNIHEVIGMFQKEVANRICSKPKNKTYGIPSVLIQAFFNCEQLFDVDADNFQPKPKVNSAIVKLTRNHTIYLGCKYDDFKKIIKSAFAQRRKKIKNALKNFTNLDNVDATLLSKRAEELSVSDFINLTKVIFPNSK